MRTHSRLVGTKAILALLAAVSLALACGPKSDGGTGAASGGFDSADAAAAALIDALRKDDVAGAQKLLGLANDDLLSSGDPVQDKADRGDLVRRYDEAHKLVAEEAGTTLVAGHDEWPFPIPLVERDGKWTFDGEAGAQELVYRRVGRNELGAIGVCRGFVEAQQEYASVGHDGDPAGIYALKLISDEGMENGLYWPTAEGEQPSPAGEFVAAAADEGYRRSEEERPAYHGYHYRLLHSQTENANGGAKDYFKDGLMTEGFALIAWPADYGSSGVMTFIVNQDGVVFQKDLGEDTATAVDAIRAYDPDSTWVAVVDPDEA